MRVEWREAGGQWRAVLGSGVVPCRGMVARPQRTRARAHRERRLLVLLALEQSAHAQLLVGRTPCELQLGADGLVHLRRELGLAEQTPLKWVDRVIMWCADKMPSMTKDTEGADAATCVKKAFDGIGADLAKNTSARAALIKKYSN